MPDPTPTEPDDVDGVAIALHMRIDTAALLLHAVELARANVSPSSSAGYILDLERLEHNLRQAITDGGILALRQRNALLGQANRELESLGLQAPELKGVNYTAVRPRRTTGE